MKTLRLFAVFLACVCSGCLLAPDAPERQWTPGVVVLAPEPNIAELAVKGAAAWSEATELSVSVGSPGILVRYVETARDAKGNPVCGATGVNYRDGKAFRVSYIEISTDVPGCASAYYSLLHEIGHALIPDVDAHASGGILAAVANNKSAEVVDWLAVALVCGVRNCPIDEH